jgi:hypothetical protein
MDSMVSNIQRELDSAGYSVIRGGALTLEQFQYIGRSLGRIHEEEQVKIKANEEVLIYRHEAIPLHNDGSEGRYLGLYCIEPGVNPVGTWLVDVSDLIEKLDPATVASLCATTFKRGWGSHEKWFNVLTLTDNSFILYYAPWKLDQPKTAEELHHRQNLAEYIKERLMQRGVCVVLEKGEALFFNNHNFLHGREALSPDSQRCLHRLWIEASQ